MKKLTRMKLINWHYIADSTIDFNGSCLITGDNGAGKSTILDALQYVLTCGKSRFNSAAHERTKRDLIGYIRCKTGNDTNTYERTGDVTAHVALEFYEEKKKKYFIIGAVIDSSSDLSNPKAIFYRLENTRINDDIFLKGNTPRNINDFKIKAKTFDNRILNTQGAAQEDFNTRFGSIGYRFYEVLPKALAFRPINNVKDFVYSYLLDEKQVNIEFLKENVRTYMEFDKVLKGIKAKLENLDNIVEKYNEIQKTSENIGIHDYIILRSQMNMDEIDVEKEKTKLKDLELVLSKGKLTEVEIDEDIKRKKNIQDELHRSLLENQSYVLINTLKKDIENLKNDHRKLLNIENKFDLSIKEIYGAAKGLLENNCELVGIKEFISGAKDLLDKEKINGFMTLINTIEDSFKNRKEETSKSRFELELRKSDIEKKLEEIEKDIKSLENRKLVYDENLITLKDTIGAEIKKVTGREAEPKIVCELLHIKDPIWKDAIEGYLNTQRFNLIIEPELFDISIDTYERVKAKKNIHSVGLINTVKLDVYKECPENSLAYVVGSNNEYAKGYVNMILGKVVRCTEVSELKKYPCSITPTCMVYQNNTARQINPKVYLKPFIGEDAYKKQLELKQKERLEYKKELEVISKALLRVKTIIELLSFVKFDYIKENSFIKYDIKIKVENIKENEEQLSRIDKSTILSLQLELDGLNKIIENLEINAKATIREIANCERDIKSCIYNIKEKNQKLTSSTENFNEFEEGNSDVVARAKERYEEMLKTKTQDTINFNYSKSKMSFVTKVNNLTEELKKIQRDYNRDFHFGGAEGLDGMRDFFREYKNLKDSKVIEYEEKIKLAREKAEEEFKEHFLAKLQENVTLAQNEFKKLNEALKGIKFGEDEYKFQCVASKEYDKFYKMIMDDNNFGGFTLFSGAYREKHKEAMEELFERITIDDENSKKALEKFTDYRTFMDYDIKINHDNGTTSSFSKVCREKSGGETQTPYYVAIAASFVQLYNSSLNNESIGLILFDEAFDKMDENRIESMMSFLNKLKLQMIIAAPPQKVESISPYVGTTLIVFKEEKFSFVEALYQNEKLQ